ncbi:hypothetical protein [Marinicellulosiphila megalodicopiae]|uniref:hypothetical protein n=1 Tax=Marinicellulosiphila megalodicopiae TaxID=2724896 RepID=UPI003BAF7AD9
MRILLLMILTLLTFYSFSFEPKKSNYNFAIQTSISSYAGDESNGIRLDYQLFNHLISIDYDTIYDSSLKQQSWKSYQFIGLSYGYISNFNHSNTQSYIRTGMGQYFNILHSQASQSDLQLFTLFGIKHDLALTRWGKLGGYIEAGSIGKGFHYKNQYELGHGFLQKIGIFWEF